MSAADIPGWVRTWHPDPVWSNHIPVNQEDLPLLFATVEHRAWVGAIVAFLRNERKALPLTHHQCSFGTWLASEGQERHGTQLAYQGIEPLHRQVHALAKDLIDLHILGNNSEALVRLDELHESLDALLAQIRSLLRER